MISRPSFFLQFFIFALDKPNAGALRAAHRKAQIAFQESRPDLFITRGTIIADDGATEIGSLMLLDVPDLTAAQAFWKEDPLLRAGLFDRVEFYRWRFGRVFTAASD